MGLALLLGTPLLLSFASSPAGRIKKSYSFLPFSSLPSADASDPDITFHSIHSSAPSSSGQPSSGHHTIPLRIYGHFGPMVAGESFSNDLKAYVEEPGDYVLNSYFVSTLTKAKTSVGKYFGMKEAAYSFPHAGTFALPSFHVPGFYVPSHEVCDVFATARKGTKTYVTTVPLRDDGDREYALPYRGAIAESNRLTVYDDGSPSSSPVYSFSGFKADYGVLSDNRLPLSAMRIAFSGSLGDFSLVKWGSASLRLSNRVEEFATGSMRDGKRFWDLSIEKDGLSFVPSLAEKCLYSYGDGRMREGDEPRDGETLTNQFYLPPCRKGEEGTKQYSFLLSVIGMGVSGEIGLRFPFSVASSAKPFGGCGDGGYCVEVGE
jgi:hypothetical protein